MARQSKARHDTTRHEQLQLTKRRDAKRLQFEMKANVAVSVAVNVVVVVAVAITRCGRRPAVRYSSSCI